MPHFSLGYLRTDATLTCSHDALKPVTIYKDVMMWGILYPRTHLSESSRKTPRFDFVVSPIPHRLWPLVGRLIVNIVHGPGALQRVATVLSEQGATILVSQGARSGHRYATWNAIIAVDDIDPRTLQGYTPTLKAYPVVVERLERIREAVLTQCADILFVEQSSDPTVNDPVRVTPHNSMAYFYSVCQKPKEELKVEGIDQDWLFYNCFRLRCTDGLSLTPVTPDGRFASIVRYIDAKVTRILPSHAFISSSSADMNMRIVVIPQLKERRFFGLTLRFNRVGHPPTSRGFLSHTLRALGNDFNVWGVSNVSHLYAEESEVGVTHLIAYDKADKQGARTNHQRETLIKEAVNVGSLPPALTSITEIRIDCYPLASLRSHASRDLLAPTYVRTFADHDIFLSYSAKDNSKAKKIEEILLTGGLTVFRDEKNIELGSNFSEEIRNGLRGSREVILLCSKQALQSDWIKRELGAAWVLNLKVMTITLNLDVEELPPDLKAQQACSYTDVIEQGRDWLFFEQFRHRHQTSPY